MSHDSLRRKYAKKMAQMRALEEEMERKNVLYGNGATPSMGLSQYRGGLMDFGAIVRPSSSCSVEQRKRLDELRQKKKKKSNSHTTSYSRRYRVRAIRICLRGTTG